MIQKITRSLMCCVLFAMSVVKLLFNFSLYIR